MVCVSLRHLRAEGHQPQKQQKPEHVSAVFCHGPWISANVSIFEQYKNQTMTLICSGFTVSLSFNVFAMLFMLLFISLSNAPHTIIDALPQCLLSPVTCYVFVNLPRIGATVACCATCSSTRAVANESVAAFCKAHADVVSGTSCRFVTNTSATFHLTQCHRPVTKIQPLIFLQYFGWWSEASGYAT